MREPAREEALPRRIREIADGVVAMPADLLRDDVPLVLQPIRRHRRSEHLLGEKRDRFGHGRVQHVDREVQLLVAGVRVVIAAELGRVTIDAGVIEPRRPLKEHVLGEMRDAGRAAIEARAGARGERDRRERPRPPLVDDAKRALAKNLVGPPVALHVFSCRNSSIARNSSFTSPGVV